MKLSASTKFQMPPEWAEHAATLLHWPSNRETWPGNRLEKVEMVFLDIIEVLHSFEVIHLIIANHPLKKRVRKLLKNRKIDLQNISLHVFPIDDVWARDCGPVFVQKSGLEKDEPIILDWNYNAWGNKYLPYTADNTVPEFLADTFNIPRIVPGMVLEGGSIEVNGNGTLLTTESVLLNPNRNPDLSKSEIEEKLSAYLSAHNIIWLKGGLAGDDTDGHVDDVARFLNDETILAMVCDDPNDVNYEVLQTNLDILANAIDLNGKPFKIETLSLPSTRICGTTVDGSGYVPASYANYYVANGVVLVPLYEKKYDKKALNLFKKYFPDRQVVGIQCGDLVWGQGSIHCITQQLYGQ